MPAFYPGEHGQVHLPNPLTHTNGDGYKAAIYEDFPPYGAASYPDQASATTHEMAPAFSGQVDRYAQPVPTTMYAPHPTPGFPVDDWYPDHPCLHPPLGAPMIAPLRVDERFVPAYADFSRAQGYAAVFEPAYPKEEKPTGGVSAKLDYDMDRMTDFVAESTVAIIKPGHHVQAAFRKWVLQVLNATRLPSATILLSLSYLAIRMRQLSTDGTFRVSERTFYKMITIALILGSKFLDDNTFQNKSWAEVSNIPVHELNQDEREWLTTFGHRLHHDPKRVDGFEAAEEQWKAFQEKANARLPALQPLDTNLRRHRSMQAMSSHYSRQHSKPAVNTHALDPALVERTFGNVAYAQYDSWYPSGYQSARERSPLSSASHSGPHTPEYIGGSGYGWGPFNAYGPRPAYTYPPLPYTPQSTTTPADFQLPPLRRQRVTAWNCHGAACQCQMCRQQNPMLSRLGPPVMA